VYDFAESNSTGWPFESLNSERPSLQSSRWVWRRNSNRQERPLPIRSLPSGSARRLRAS